MSAAKHIGSITAQPAPAHTVAVPAGLTELDALHDLLFATLDQTCALPPARFPAAFPLLVEAVEQNFRHEEALLECLECPDTRLHREQHARMLAGLHHAAAVLGHGDDTLARRALRALQAWLPIHIATHDRQLVRYLRRPDSES